MIDMMTTNIYNKNRMRNMMAGVFICLLTTVSCVLTSCSDNDSDAPLNFYSSVRLTAAGFIEADESQFSDFKAILERGNYLSMLKTYGHYTVFVPTNDAVQAYLKENGYASLSDIPSAICDTLARTHIVQEKAYFTTDMGGEVPPVNMNDDYIKMTSDSDVYNNNALLIYVNKSSRIIQKDDSVTNGVVHVIDHVIKANNVYLPDLLEQNPNLSLFCKAMRKTGVDMELTKYIDDTYAVLDPDSAEGGKGFPVVNRSGSDGGLTTTTYYPLHRYFKFTAFVETDSIFKENGITSLEKLEEYAKQVYDEAYPEDAGKYDNEYTDRRNPLNRFVSYHFINRIGPREYWVHCKGPIYEQKFLIDIADPEDYYETMAPHTLMRFCSNPGEEIYINRKAQVKNKKVEVPGVRVLKDNEVDKRYEQSCMNGTYHYIDKILTYSKDVRWNVLNRRLRFDSSTLSPDFMNARARMAHMNEDFMMIGYKRGYLTDFKMYNDNTFIGCGNEQTSWVHYQGSGVCITGEKYDAALKLPPVPHDGTYEVRIGYSQGDDRGIAQVYLNDEACGIPVSFRVFDRGYEFEWDTDDEEENKAIDKAMHNIGFMKAMDSYGNSSDGSSFRSQPNCARRILVKQTLRADQDNWLRFRQILEGNSLYMSLDYIELCPKEVYDDPDGEDRH